jgi:Fe2+ or Zn2+ uptake regulation protein
MAQEDETHLFCHRCGAVLEPGAGDFYVARIEAFADPTPPNISAEELAATDPSAEIERLLEQMRDMSERELMDQVYRRVTIHLCGPCYRRWIENPAG